MRDVLRAEMQLGFQRLENKIDHLAETLASRFSDCTLKFHSGVFR